MAAGVTGVMQILGVHHMVLSGGVASNQAWVASVLQEKIRKIQVLGEKAVVIMPAITSTNVGIIGALALLRQGS
ncbi:MAG: hypothetical protein AAFQ87_18025 [Bacteroidota bacterium]